MTAILGVHGIAKQQFGPDQILSTWKPALRDGIQLAIGRDALRQFRPRLDIAFYGDLFLRDLETNDSKGSLDDEQALDADELAFMSEIAGDVAAEVEADGVIGKGRQELPRPLGKLATWLDRRFGAAAPAMFIGELKQVRRYERDDNFASEVRNKVIELLDGVEVVVGHSLGSVVAFETLAVTPGNAVKRLVTIGSPLALPTVVKGLRAVAAVPGQTMWTNIYDPSDAVACAGGIEWPGITNVMVDNEHNPHSAERYLTKQVTGHAITGTARPR